MADEFDYDAVVTIIEQARRITRSQRQMAPFGGVQNFIALLVNVATYYAYDVDELRAKLTSAVDAKADATRHAVQRYKDISLGVSIATVSATPLMFVPVVGWVIAGATAITNVATMPETDRRHVEARNLMQDLSDTSKVLTIPYQSDLLRFSEFIDQLEALNHADPKDAAAGLMTIVLFASTLPTGEDREAMIRDTLESNTDCALVRLLRGIQIQGISPQAISDQNIVGLVGHQFSAVSWMMRLAGAPGKFALQGVLVGAIKLGLPFAGSVKVLNSIARGTKVLRVAGKVLTVITLPFEIVNLVSICRTTDDMFAFVDDATKQYHTSINEVIDNIRDVQRTLATTP
ncbi:hypothetical protein DYB28_013932 [Aphanomyces astaci]|uniref:Uncharacterized protein n=1 Tax=Aphanomyces astaci TaxID=112090 RepID=A0A397AQG8_APHAT|nr:hypothetical protein DYB36_001090 [Aphanomyces astaci]RHY55012.1 hypothetical protein DYB34_002936 [Aphanomyces astaci]RHY71295.1 hypothetical protein DYB30_009751 [Aphanomyces astaci]RHY98019.1 hypothetical protein DYB26_012603 [Aphanomyces astaci]RHZ15720.1 hypothetical protein DYB31_012606 [Aphanomyces astaci]